MATCAQCDDSGYYREIDQPRVCRRCAVGRGILHRAVQKALGLKAWHAPEVTEHDDEGDPSENHLTWNTVA